MIVLLPAESAASETSSTSSAQNVSTPRSDVPAPPSNMAVGGKATLQPKRTPVSDREIEAILVSVLKVTFHLQEKFI